MNTGATGASPVVLWTLGVLFLVGCGVKAAVLPLHTWLPLAMVAPTPVSALLHAVAVVKAGVFGLVRVTGFVFGADLLADLGAGRALVWLAAATIVLASLAALAQDNLKRLLAFSTISQLSYIVLGVALGPRDAFTGGVLHMASHGLMKITLFFCAGAIAATAHLDRVSQLTGIGRRMPLTMAAFALAAFMLAGLPPGAGFVSKWLLLLGGLEASAWVAVVALLASTVLNIAYFAPIVVRAWMPPASPGTFAEAPPTMLVPLLLTAFVGGALADTVDRRRMVLVTDVGLAVGSALLAVNAALPQPRLWPLYVAAAVLSALNGLQRPSLEAMTPRLVAPEEIPAAAALQTFRGSVGMIAGPALGGMLLATTGLTVTFGRSVTGSASLRWNGSPPKSSAKGGTVALSTQGGEATLPQSVASAISGNAPSPRRRTSLVGEAASLLRTSRMAS